MGNDGDSIVVAKPLSELKKSAAWFNTGKCWVRGIGTRIKR
jgi:hypothetical protein